MPAELGFPSGIGRGFTGNEVTLPFGLAASAPLSADPFAAITILFIYV
jgi:hypothetical protein